MRRFQKITLTLQLIVASAAFAAEQTPLEVMGGSYPDPAMSEGHVVLRNNGDKSVVCTIKMTGVISGQFRGTAVKARHESEPAEGFLLEPGQEREQVFKFQRKVQQMRSFWGDAGAILTEIDADSLVARCTYEEAQPTGGSTPGNASSPDEGTYMLINQHSGKCLNLEVTALNQNGYDNGRQVFQYDCPQGDGGGWTNSYWRVRHEGSGQVRLESQYSGKCLDLYTLDGGHNNGARVQQFDCYGARSSTLNRNWVFSSAGQPSSYYVQSAFSGKCLELSADRPGIDGYRNRDKVQQWDCGAREYRANQIWSLVRVN